MRVVRIGDDVLALDLHDLPLDVARAVGCSRDGRLHGVSRDCRPRVDAALVRLHLAHPDFLVETRRHAAVDHLDTVRAQHRLDVAGQRLRQLRPLDVGVTAVRAFHHDDLQAFGRQRSLGRHVVDEPHGLRAVFHEVGQRDVRDARTAGQREQREERSGNRRGSGHGWGSFWTSGCRLLSASWANRCYLVKPSAATGPSARIASSRLRMAFCRATPWSSRDAPDTW